jgi:hypothetical protein
LAHPQARSCVPGQVRRDLRGLSSSRHRRLSRCTDPHGVDR